jgi:adenylate cyclase
VKKKSEPLAWLESGTGERSPLGQNFVIGRSADCQMPINDARVSRRHAMIHCQGNREFWLVDLGSANGTRLNGRRLSQPCRLQDQDRIEIADSRFVFRQANPSPPTPRSSLPVTEATMHEIRTFNCWLLLADMVDSTQVLRRLESAQAAGLTGRWLARCKAIIDTCHGTVNKFLGDGLLAYWPDTPGAAAGIAEALRAFQKLQEEAQPVFRVVLHYGPAASGGAPSLGEESLAGKEVTFAFRMEELASILGTGLLISEAAALKLQPWLQASPVGSHNVNSFEGTFNFFSLP